MGCCGGAKKKAVNIAKGYVALARKKKFEFTDDRVRTCQDCDYRKWLGKTLWCKICKCYVPAKARVEDEKCPKDFWSK